MRLNAKARRRWFGGLCLLTAVGMLVTGETVLQDRLSPVGFLLYWIGCFVVTALAAKAALLDAAHVRAESRAEQRVLFEDAADRTHRSISKTTCREIRLVSRPDGMPSTANFYLAQTELAPLQDQEVLVRNF